MLSGNVFVILGGIFTLIGGGIAVPCFAAGLFSDEVEGALLAGGFGLIFAAIGLPLFLHGYRRGRATLQSFEHGEATIGRVSEVFRDTSIKINGRSPWAIRFTFEAQGRTYTFEGVARTWDETASERKPGQPIHVLYWPQDPKRNTIYPPVR